MIDNTTLCLGSLLFVPMGLAAAACSGPETTSDASSTTGSPGTSAAGGATHTATTGTSAGGPTTAGSGTGDTATTSTGPTNDSSTNDSSASATSAGTTATTGGNTTDPCTGSRSLSAGDSSHTLTVGGTDYPMNVHVPASYDGVTRMPVVFDFHGRGGSENTMQRLSGWAATGDANGFITVFPGGPDSGWNAGSCCTDTPTDVDFVRDAIDYLDAEGCIDTKRIYASGCSNGGALSYRLACEAADVIAAIAPVDFDCVVGGPGCAQCEPSRPITEIQFRATEDEAFEYGTESSGALANFATWKDINQCTGSAEPWEENSSCQRHTGCSDGVETILCTVEGGTHCANYMSFDIANLAWGVISKYSLP